MNMNKIESDYIKIFAYILIFLGIIILGCYIYTMYISEYTILERLNNKDVEITGQFGDFFGGVIGSLWTLAGVFLYFSALKVQQEQLKAQKAEMKQNETLLSQQQFENTFFGLLQTQKELKKDLYCNIQIIKPTDHRNNYTFESIGYDSKHFFQYIVQELKYLYLIYKREKFCSWDNNESQRLIDDFNNYAEYCKEQEEPFNYSQEFNKVFHELKLSYLTSLYQIKEKTITLAKNKDTEELLCCSIYGHILLTYQEQLGHYFRHLYNIVKFLDIEKEKNLAEIKNKDNEEKEKEFINKRFANYFSFIHSILSTPELTILYYNSMLFPKARKLYVKYGMFNNLLKENLINQEHSTLIEGANLKEKKELFQEIIDRLTKD